MIEPETSDHLPAVSWDLSVPTRIQTGDSGPAAMPLQTIPAVFKKRAEEFSAKTALVYEDSFHTWKSVSYAQYYAKVEHVAKAFIKLGLQPRHSVGVLGPNCPEWFYAEMAAICAGGLSAGIYTTNSAEAVFHVLEKARANIVVVDDTAQLEKVLLIRSRLPQLKAIVQIQAPYASQHIDGYYRWPELEKMDVSGPERDEYPRRLASLKVNEAAVLIFTSGTTGMPKGVMLSHDNILFTCHQLEMHLKDHERGQNSLISYLPMSHVAAQCLDLFYGFYGACAVYFADRNALKAGLINTLRISRPTQFGAVPRVFEKIRDGLVENEEKQGKLVRRLMSWARGAALAYHKDVSLGGTASLYRRIQYLLARLVVLNEVKVKLGLDRCSDVISGAAPISRDLKMFFLSYDLPVMETYGMSESTGPVTIFESRNWDSVGKALPGTEVTVREPDAQGHGELCMKGRHIFMGYVGEEEKTREAFDEQGRLRSGDIGYVDEKGFLYITGRMKELIITAGGENIPPVHIEQLVKHELPCVSNAFLVGDHRKYLTMLITLKTQMNPETGAPMDQLHKETLDFCRALGLPYETLSEIIKAGPCKKVKQAIEEGIARANKHAISKAQCVQKFEILDHDFSVPTGELGPTLKVKRSVVVNMYANAIERMYQ